MEFEKSNNNIMFISKNLGFVFAYFVFTTTMFFILTFSRKLPENWFYFHVMSITFFVTVTGKLIKYWFG